MINYTIQEYEEYLNETVKIDNEDGFGTHLRKNCEQALRVMWSNLFQLNQSISGYFARKKAEEIKESASMKELVKTLEDLETIDHMIDNRESVEVVTQINGVNSDELVAFHTLEIFNALNARSHKKCYLRIMTEVTIDPENNIGLYTRFIFA